jgi:hypothetical protein
VCVCVGGGGESKEPSWEKAIKAMAVKGKERLHADPAALAAATDAQ